MFKKYLQLFNSEEYFVTKYNRFNPNEWAFFLEIYKNIFRKIDKSVFQWYFDLGNSFSILSSKDNKHFGIYGLLNINMEVQNKPLKAYLCHNVGIKSTYSGKGFFQFIGEKALVEVLGNDELALGFPNKASKKGHLRLGWEEIGSMEFMAYTSSCKKELPSNKKYLFEKVSTLPKSIDELLNQTSDMFSLRLVKDSEFLNWRISKPFSTYKIYLIKESRKLVGYLVLKEYVEGNERRLHLVDFLFINTDVLNSLIEFSINMYKNNSYDVLNTWIVTDSFYKKMFLTYAFIVPEDMPIYPIILFQKEKMFDFQKINKNKLFFTLFDNDVF